MYVTLYQRGLQPLRWGTRKENFSSSINRIIDKIKNNKRFDSFDISDPNKTRIHIEFVTKRQILPSINLLETNTKSIYRFEPGITGFYFQANGKEYFYMPSEAFTKSHLSLKQVFSYLAKKMRIKDPKRRKRILKAINSISYIELIESRAYVSYKDDIFELYRGYPFSKNISNKYIEDSFFKGAEWILRNIKSNGQFLYYYDGYRDSTIDFLHRNNPNYYNIIRHNCGIIALLKAYELSNSEKFLNAAKKTIEYMLQYSKSRNIEGKKCRYIFFNNKSKLGSEGLALTAIMHYYRLSNDDTYLSAAHEIACHIISRIDNNGEILTYYIHPKYNNGQPLENISAENRKKLFSIYYPGEAMLGLALYEHYAPLAEEKKKSIRDISKKAFSFLINECPKKYPQMYKSLPSDAWLMQAIEEFWYHPEMQKQDYADYVYKNAKKMIDHMYKKDDALYKDYVGHYYYEYGDHAYPDGARSEGLLSAYFLSKMQNKKELSKHLFEHIVLSAKGLMQTLNTPESMYAILNPEKYKSSFRFKLTRQWVRVDSTQHTSCFIGRLIPEL